MSFDPLRQNDPDLFVFEWAQRLVSEHQPGKHYGADALVRPKIPTGFFYRASTAGQAAWRPPAWPRTNGATVSDGSVTWTTENLATASEPSIANVVYTITPAGITQSNAAIVAAELASQVRLDASAAELGIYEIVALMTDSGGEEYQVRTELEVIE